MIDTASIPVIELTGTAGERGRAHGEIFHHEIHDILDAWAGELQRVCGLDREQYVAEFFRRSNFGPALERFTPFLLDELKGIAEAAGVDYLQLLAFQHSNEEYWLSASIKSDGGHSGEHCSTIGFAGDTDVPTLLCQNLDMAMWLDGRQVLFRSQGEDPANRLMLVSVPGMISLNGLNCHGIAVADNCLLQLGHSTSGLPAFAIYRAVLECTSFEDADKLIRAVPHASGLNWLIGGPGRVAMYECSANKVMPFRPFGQSERLYHTNHPLVNDDQSAHFERLRSTTGFERSKGSRSTFLRHAALHDRLGDRSVSLDVDIVRQVLSSRDDPDYPLSRDLDPGGDGAADFTFSSSICELAEDATVLHLASGPPHCTAFRTFRFD